MLYQAYWLFSPGNLVRFEFILNKYAIQGLEPQLYVRLLDKHHGWTIDRTDDADIEDNDAEDDSIDGEPVSSTVSSESESEQGATWKRPVGQPKAKAKAKAKPKAGPCASRFGPNIIIPKIMCRVCGSMVGDHWGNECPELRDPSAPTPPQSNRQRKREAWAQGLRPHAQQQSKWQRSDWSDRYTTTHTHTSSWWSSSSSSWTAANVGTTWMPYWGDHSNGPEIDDIDF
jgi:hypothetical protein